MAREQGEQGVQERLQGSSPEGYLIAGFQYTNTFYPYFSGELASSRLALLITQNSEIMRKRIKTIQVNGQFKKVETRTATKAVWQQEITCVKVTSQTVAGAEKSRKYLRANAEKAQKTLERKEQLNGR